MPRASWPTSSKRSERSVCDKSPADMRLATPIASRSGASACWRNHSAMVAPAARLKHSAGSEPNPRRSPSSGSSAATVVPAMAVSISRVPKPGRKQRASAALAPVLRNSPRCKLNWPLALGSRIRAYKASARATSSRAGVVRTDM